MDNKDQQNTKVPDSTTVTACTEYVDVDQELVSIEIKKCLNRIESYKLMLLQDNKERLGRLTNAEIATIIRSERHMVAYLQVALIGLESANVKQFRIII